jgi:transposase-like protein
MDFPIVDLMDREACLTWIRDYFHPDGMRCPHCGEGLEQARWFRRTRRSDLDVYRCRVCKGIYNVYSGTVFAGRSFTPEQTVLFMREVLQGKPTAQLARELGISRTTATDIRHRLQANAEREQPQNALTDLEVETDEMFQNAGEKRSVARRPAGPASPPGQQTPGAGYICQ